SRRAQVHPGVRDRVFVRRARAPNHQRVGPGSTVDFGPTLDVDEDRIIPAVAPDLIVPAPAIEDVRLVIPRDDIRLPRAGHVLDPGEALDERECLGVASIRLGPDLAIRGIAGQVDVHAEGRARKGRGSGHTKHGECQRIDPWPAIDTAYDAVYKWGCK